MSIQHIMKLKKLALRQYALSLHLSKEDKVVRNKSAAIDAISALSYRQ